MRGFLFPVHWHEMKSFLPMALMMLFILCNYTILRNLKDTLVVNADGSGAEVISFLKLWGTMPSAIIFMIIYSKLANLFSREKIFYVCLIPFMIFFAAFAYVIYPNTAFLHPNPATVASLQENFPNFKWFLAIWGNWSYALFYILAELWGSVMLSLLFWQFANDIVKKEQTKRFYPLFGMIANVGLICAGLLAKYFAASGDWQNTLHSLVGIVLVGGTVVGALFYYINRNLDKEALVLAAPIEKKKAKLSITESLRYLATSPHLLCIALIVLGYGISINYVDVIWKGQAKELFAGSKAAYSDYMGNFSITTGLIAIPIMLVAGNLLRKISWKKAALITPIILLSTGFGFFSLILLGQSFGNPNAPIFEIGSFSVTFLWLGVQFGLLQNALTKATKYSLFDSTKEMAYIPLDKELKTKGKAAVDVVASRLGKSGGALTFFIIQSILPNVTLVSQIPFLAIATLLILGVWFFAVGKLDKSIKELNGEAEKSSREPVAGILAAEPSRA